MHYKIGVTCAYEFTSVWSHDQTLVCSLHVMLNCEIDGLDGYAITNSMDLALRAHLFYNALVHVIYSRVSGQYSHAIKVNIEH